MNIQRNVGGVPGLHIAYDAFSEEIEKRLFENPCFPASGGDSGKEGITLNPLYFPDDWFRLINAVQDCGLYPEMQHPNYALNLTYSNKGSFMAHRDSPYRWGESIVGVCIGMECVFEMRRMVNDNPRGATNKTVSVQLPRRCLYVLVDDARTSWKHAIKKISKQTPEWNPNGLRKSITFRSFKSYSSVLHEINGYSTEEHRVRIEESKNRYTTDIYYGTKRLSKKDLEVARESARVEISLYDCQLLEKRSLRF